MITGCAAGAALANRCSAAETCANEWFRPDVQQAVRDDPVPVSTGMSQSQSASLARSAECPADRNRVRRR